MHGTVCLIGYFTFSTSVRPSVSPRRDRAGGFTLVELLVVIAIIGILMSLMLPAVAAVRESARRMQCKNKLKQLATAIRSYETMSGVLPPLGTVADPPQERAMINLRSGTQFSWIVLILPELEQQSLHSQFDFTESAFAQPNEPQSTPLSILICPSEGVAQYRVFNDSGLTQDKTFAKGNYAAFVGPYHTDNCLYFPGAIVARGRSAARIRDGLSNTIMLSEVRTRDHPQDQRGAWALPWTGSTLLSVDWHQTLFRDEQGNEVGPYEDWSLRYVPTSYVSPAGVERNRGAAQPPNRRSVRNFDMLYKCPDEAGAQLEGMPCAVCTDLHWLSAAPRSNHQGGVNIAFADGHTGFLPDVVDEKAMAMMTCAEDGNVVGLAGGSLP